MNNASTQRAFSSTFALLLDCPYFFYLGSQDTYWSDRPFSIPLSPNGRDKILEPGYEVDSVSRSFRFKLTIIGPR